MPLAPEFVQVPRKELSMSEASKKTKSYPLNFKVLSKAWASPLGGERRGERESCTSETQQACCCGDACITPAPTEAVRP